MELSKGQLILLKGYICNINFTHELYGVEKTLKLLGVEPLQIKALCESKSIELQNRKHYKRGKKEYNCQN